MPCPSAKVAGWARTISLVGASEIPGGRGVTVVVGGVRATTGVDASERV